MLNNLIFALEDKKATNEIKTVVRLKTSYWCDNRGIHQRKDLLFLKSKGYGWEFFKEDADAIGAEDLVGNIANFEDCKDGIYELIMCNKSYDYESGHLDSWDWELSPYQEEV